MKCHFGCYHLMASLAMDRDEFGGNLHSVIDGCIAWRVGMSKIPKQQEPSSISRRLSVYNQCSGFCVNMKNRFGPQRCNLDGKMPRLGSSRVAPHNLPTELHSSQHIPSINTVLVDSPG